MGLGEALMEEMTYRGNRNVVHKFPSMLEYKSPTTMEMCDVKTYLIEDPDPNGPYGAKEVGQGPLLPVPPAVANAVYDAVGVRIDEVPITPEKVLKALKEKARGRDPRYGPDSVPTVEWPEPLRVLTPAEGGDGNLRYKLSKESASKTLSFLLQDNFSGRAEIGLTVTDIERSRRFYETVFGWPVLLEVPDNADEATRRQLGFLFGGVIYDLGGALIALRPVASDRFHEDRAGLDHLAFRANDKAELDSAAEYLDELGIDHEPVKDIGPAYILEFRDPDNIALELFAPPE